MVDGSGKKQTVAAGYKAVCVGLLAACSFPLGIPWVSTPQVRPRGGCGPCTAVVKNGGAWVGDGVNIIYNMQGAMQLAK